jgi:hypothetical protein
MFLVNSSSAGRLFFFLTELGRSPALVNNFTPSVTRVEWIRTRACLPPGRHARLRAAPLKIRMHTVKVFKNVEI